MVLMDEPQQDAYGCGPADPVWPDRAHDVAVRNLRMDVVQGKTPTPWNLSVNQTVLRY